jgi:hypothetical protein
MPRMIADDATSAMSGAEKAMGTDCHRARLAG